REEFGQAQQNTGGYAPRHTENVTSAPSVRQPQGRGNAGQTARTQELVFAFGEA
ncbi:hypothetical protein U1Q18_009003, partial [Sarracenia purpurea var. burkii]